MLSKCLSPVSHPSKLIKSEKEVVGTLISNQSAQATDSNSWQHASDTGKAAVHGSELLVCAT